MIFKTIVFIDSGLREFVEEIKRYFSVDIDDRLIEKIIEDSRTNQVTEKHYTIFEEDFKLVKSPRTILGTVEEYEPETIWIEIKNIGDKDIKHFEDFRTTLSL